jgi:hypothetical protein
MSEVLDSEVSDEDELELHESTKDGDDAFDRGREPTADVDDDSPATTLDLSLPEVLCKLLKPLKHKMQH